MVLRTWPLLVVLALVVNLALAGGPWAGEVHACSCISSPLKNEIQRSDAVFSGEVRSIDEGLAPGSDEGATTIGGIGTATGKVSFAVRDTWKGITAGTVEIYGQGDGANCYNVFEEGESYIVYASRKEGTGAPAPLENNGCGGTKPLASAEKDLRLLGSPMNRLPQTGGPPLPFAGALVAAALAGVLLAGDAARRR